MSYFFTYSKFYFLKKRQYKLSKLSNLPFTETFAFAGKGVVAGVIYGISGLAISPYDGRETFFEIEKRDRNLNLIDTQKIELKARGPRGIFRGIGKGLLGFVAKPVGSLFDSLSLTLDGLKRFSQAGSEIILQTRLPRHLVSNGVI